MLQNDYSRLFEPLRLRTLTLRNRIVVPPMVTLRNIVGDDGVRWYRRMARGGAGLVIVESTPVVRFGTQLTLHGLRRLTDAVHAEGSAIAIQLFPVERGSQIGPQDLSLDDISRIVEGYASAAALCKETGFDGVEPHGAHGFLLNQFFSPLRNQRADRYGGTPENRMRMGREIVQAIRREVGDSILVLYRHTPREMGSYTIDDSVAFARCLVEDGVDVMDISPASGPEPGELSEPFKRALDCPVIAVNDMDDPDRAAAALKLGRADLIAIGRGLIADPEWPHKVLERRFSDIVVCTKCDEACYGNLARGVPVGCTEWPAGQS